MSIDLQPTGIVFRPDNRRVLVRPFITSDAGSIRHIIDRALSLGPSGVEEQLALIRADFDARHVDLEDRWRRNFELVKAYVPEGVPIDDNLRLYLGALFSGEYALESAALFNPSIVAHPDQSGVPAGSVRYILSLRATGEGHISSIEFRSGIIHADATIEVDEVSRFVIAPGVKENPTYRKTIFQHKLQEMGFENDWSWKVIDSLGNDFTRRQLEEAMARATEGIETLSREIERTRECVQWLAKSNYEVHFQPATTLSQRIIFPVSPNETNGIEDARFVRFVDDDGSVVYYATYTAYNGHAILPQFIETRDFASFAVCTLNGQAVQNKGMALFPRRINGRYAMISRQDDENLFLMTSDNIHFWNEPQLLRRPTMPWEFVKIGNCGSPLETEAGWLVITHGVGPMRRYCIGAILLDLDDPSQVIGWLEKPLIEPSGEYREGYVPNVVYSCGAMLHGSRLILPYALSDTSSTVVTLEIGELLAALTRPSL
ncbi:MAG TPA: glycoside hydrolase family 130 protein [Chthoniobacterales bacterium]|nr:glycoside hydrolase family 130 protein [Chthoniobacterales bacterium]